jgi:hypothetical protein
VQPLDLSLSLSLSLYLVLSAIDPRSQPARRFAPVRFHLPVILLSTFQFSVPGPHQTNLLGQPRFSSRPMAETVSAHDRAPQPRTVFVCSLNRPACPINPHVTLGRIFSACAFPCRRMTSCSQGQSPKPCITVAVAPGSCCSRPCCCSQRHHHLAPASPLYPCCTAPLHV